MYINKLGFKLAWLFQDNRMVNSHIKIKSADVLASITTAELLFKKLNSFQHKLVQQIGHFSVLSSKRNKK